MACAHVPSPPHLHALICLAFAVTVLNTAAVTNRAAESASGKQCKPECSDKGNASWDLDDGPCMDVRHYTSMLAAYGAAIEFAQLYYAYSDWKQMNWTAVRLAGLAQVSIRE